MHAAPSSAWPPPPVRHAWQLSRDAICDWQLQQLNAQLQTILPGNAFYHAKFSGCRPYLKSLHELSDLPFTTKHELTESAAAAPSGISRHHTFERQAYSRLHRTSGTTGQPLMVLDTQQDWQWWSSTWQHVLEAADISRQDRVFMAFSFGPFIGFWSAHQACVDRGATVIPGGGLSTLARLEFMRQAEVTAVCCTPSYALHLAAVAEAEAFPLERLGVRRVIVAGEAGGSVPAVRAKIESAWQAQVVDHSGATEIGPWGFGWPDHPGLHIIETCFIAELLPLSEPKASGANTTTSDSLQLAELIITSLGRHGAPLIRYRTGDIVTWQAASPAGRCNFLWLPQGVVGRADDMVTVRGVNIFPSSIETLIRELPQVAEYRVLVTREGALDQLQLEVEADEGTRSQLEKLLTVRLGLRIPVSCVPAGSLPRSELKSRRWIDHRF